MNLFSLLLLQVDDEDEEGPKEEVRLQRVPEEIFGDDDAACMFYPVTELDADKVRNIWDGLVQELFIVRNGSAKGLV